MAYAVPNPYVATTHPYPTRYHGGLWTRPVFGFPRMASVQSNFKAGDFNDGNPALRGLGMLFNAENGVFGTEKNGGGVFGPSLYGLQGQSDDIQAIADAILSTGTHNAAAYDLQTQFRAWFDNLSAYDKTFSDDAMAQATSFRDRFNAANAGKSSAPAPTAFTAAQVQNLQTMLNGALTAAGYNPIAADGKVGPGTCGAIKWYRTAKGIPTAGASFDGICSTKGSTAPTKRSSGGGTYTPPATTPDAAPPAAQASAMPSAGTLAMIGGGVLAVALAVVGKKKGWF
jgi:hypothetical protein